MRARAWIWVLALGCTAEEGGLDGQLGADAGAPGADAGAAAGDAGAAPDAGSAPAACDFGSLPAQNRRDVLRLGFALAETVIEAEVAAPVASGDRRLSAATIRRVHRGHAFLEEDRVAVELDAPTVARGDFPRTLLLGFTEPGLPVAREAGLPELSRVLIAAEQDEIAQVEDRLGYRVPDEPYVAGVRFVGVRDDRIEAEVVEPIAGSSPVDRLVFNWRGPYALTPPTGMHIVTLGYPPSRLPDGTWLGTTSDVRPFTASARAEIERALADRTLPVDGPALAAAADQFTASWRFHRAPRVVVADVDGLAGECCTGAGGTYVSYAVQEDLRGDTDAARFVRGGHAYYSEEACGDRRILGLDSLVASVGPEAFSCAPEMAGLETGLPVSRVHAERADGPEARAEVQAWLTDPEPHYRLSGEDGAFVGAPSDGPWSAPRSALEALAFGELVRVRVVSVAEREDGATEVLLETPLATAFYDHLEVRRIRVVYTCGDPRLEEIGAEWLAPLFGAVDYDAADAGAAEGGLFLVPGVLFDPDGPAEALQMRVRRRFR